MATARPIESSTPLAKRRVSRMAVAAGATIRANTSSTPTIWIASAVVKATITMNSAVRRPVGTPRASASSGWRLANSSGRAMIASARRVTADMPSSTQTVSWLMPSTLPNSRLVAMPA